MHLGVLATVISRPSDRVILDAGNKSLGAPALASIKGNTTSRRSGSTRSTGLRATPETTSGSATSWSSCPDMPPAPVNRYDAYHVEDDHVVDVWPVIPRGPGHGGLADDSSGFGRLCEVAAVTTGEFLRREVRSWGSGDDNGLPDHRQLLFTDSRVRSR